MQGGFIWLFYGPRACQRRRGHLSHTCLSWMTQRGSQSMAISSSSATTGEQILRDKNSYTAAILKDQWTFVIPSHVLFQTMVPEG